MEKQPDFATLPPESYIEGVNVLCPVACCRQTIARFYSPASVKFIRGLQRDHVLRKHIARPVNVRLRELWHERYELALSPVQHGHDEWSDARIQRALDDGDLGEADGQLECYACGVLGVAAHVRVRVCATGHAELLDHVLRWAEEHAWKRHPAFPFEEVPPRDLTDLMPPLVHL